MRKILLGLLILVVQSSAPAQFSSSGIIPLKFNPGARYQGMGNTCVSIAYDANTVFSNPGALVWSKGVFVSLKDFKNVYAAEAYPSGNATTLGIGMLINSFDNIPLTSGPGSTSSNSLLLSYAARLDSFFPMGEYEELSKQIGFGVTLKTLLGQSFEGPGTGSLSGNGWEIDAGLLYRALPWFDLGIAGYNLLPYKTLGGGALYWTNAPSESIPSFFKVGLAARLVGDIRSPIYWEDNRILLAADIELRKSALINLGCEWTNSNRHYVRTGLSQNIVSDKVETSPSIGAGYRADDWQVDISYGKEPINQETACYASVIYFPKDWFFIAHPIINLSLKNDQATFRSSIEVSGQVRPEMQLSINSIRVPTDADGNFKTLIPLNIGDNPVSIQTEYMGEKQSVSYNVARRSHPQSPADIIFPVGTDIVFSDRLDISGKAPVGMEQLLINGQPVVIDQFLGFTASIPLAMGKNVIDVEGKYEGFSVSKSYTFFRKSPPRSPPPELPEVKPFSGQKSPAKPVATRARSGKKLKRTVYKPVSAAIKSPKVKISYKRPSLVKKYAGYGTNRISRTALKKAGKSADKIWDYLQGSGYIDPSGKLSPQFDGSSYTPSPGLTDKENQAAQEALKQAYNPFAASQGLPKEEQWKGLATSAFSKNYADLPQPGKRPVSIYNFQKFGDKRAQIWNALINEGYIDGNGRPLNKFDGNRKNFKVGMRLNRQEQDEVFRILSNPPVIGRGELKEMIKEDTRARRESGESIKALEKAKKDQEKFEKLQELIERTANLTITKKIKLKMPKGYLAVYVLTDGRYLSLRYLGHDQVSVETYYAATGKWTTITRLPYSTVKNLI